VPRPVTKKFVPVKVRCSMMDGRGRGCTRAREYRCIREDGSTQELCRACAYKLRDQLQHYPTYFSQVRFEQLDVRSQLDKW